MMSSSPASPPDGVAETASDWMSEVDEDLLTNPPRWTRSQDDILLGRGTYDYGAGGPADPRTSSPSPTPPRHARGGFTSSAPTVPWSRSTTVEGTLGSPSSLKSRSGGDIGVHGILRPAQSLLADDLVDRLELVRHAQPSPGRHPPRPRRSRPGG